MSTPLLNEDGTLPERTIYEKYVIETYRGNKAKAMLEGPLLNAQDQGHYELVDQWDGFPEGFSLATIRKPSGRTILAYAILYPGILAMFEARDTRVGAILFRWIREAVGSPGLIGYNLRDTELLGLMDAPEPEPLSILMPEGGIPMDLVQWGKLSQAQAALHLLEARLPWWSNREESE